MRIIIKSEQGSDEYETARREKRTKVNKVRMIKKI